MPSRYILFQNITFTFILAGRRASTTKAYTDVHDEWAKEVQRASAGDDRPWVKSRTSRRDQSREGASIHGKWVSDTYSGIHPATFPEDTDPSTSADEKMKAKSLLQIAEDLRRRRRRRRRRPAAAAARARAPEQRRLRSRPQLAGGALPAAVGFGGRRACRSGDGRRSGEADAGGADASDAARARAGIRLPDQGAE